MHCVSSLLLHTENAMEVAMNKLILTISMIGFALIFTQAEAGSPNHKLHRDRLASMPHTTQCDCSNCSAEHCRPISEEQRTIFIITQRPTP